MDYHVVLRTPRNDKQQKRPTEVSLLRFAPGKRRAEAEGM